MQSLDNNYIPFEKHKNISVEYSNHLDTLRWISAYVVLLAHIHQIYINPINSSFSDISAVFAQMGVMIFFVLSGFLISKSISKNISLNGKFLTKQFISSRINRILPPFIFSMIITFVLWCVAPKLFPSKTNEYLNMSLYLARDGFYLDAIDFLGTLFFANEFVTPTISVNGPLWSLSFEVWYYVLAAIYCSKSFRFNFLTFLAVLLILTILNYIFLVYFFVWLLGVLLSEIHNNNIRWKNSLYFAWIVLICCFSLFLFVYLSMYFSGLIKKTLILGFGNVIFSLLFVIYLFFVLEKQQNPASLFESLSKHSYSLYIYHFPLLLFLFGRYQTEIFSTSLSPYIYSMYAFFLIVLVSYFSGKYIEAFKLYKK